MRAGFEGGRQFEDQDSVAVLGMSFLDLIAKLDAGLHALPGGVVECDVKDDARAFVELQRECATGL